MGIEMSVHAKDPLPTNKPDLKSIIDESKELLSTIARRLSIIYPLSTLPKFKHHLQVAHAIDAINLCQCILRDIEYPKNHKRKNHEPIK